MSKKVLIVDDHHDTSFTLYKLLKTEGYDVDHAIDGLCGYHSAAAGHPDLIVTDIQMPRMNGIEMIKRIKSQNDLSSIHIIVMSAYGKRIIDDAMDAGADGYIEKPLDFGKFLAAVKNLLPNGEASLNANAVQAGPA
jgi:DNA-binding response OmpR family regulator